MTNTSSAGPHRSAFSRDLRHEIEIAATPDRVWEALTNTADYSWNPFIHRIEGKLAVGEKLQVEIEPPDGRAMTFKPTVLEVAPARSSAGSDASSSPACSTANTASNSNHSMEPHTADSVRTLQRHPRAPPE